MEGVGLTGTTPEQIFSPEDADDAWQLPSTGTLCPTQPEDKNFPLNLRWSCILSAQHPYNYGTDITEQCTPKIISGRAALSNSRVCPSRYGPNDAATTTNCSSIAQGIQDGSILLFQRWNLKSSTKMRMDLWYKSKSRSVIWHHHHYTCTTTTDNIPMLVGISPTLTVQLFHACCSGKSKTTLEDNLSNGGDHHNVVETN